MSDQEFRTSEDQVNGWHRVVIERIPHVPDKVNYWMVKDTDPEVARRKADELLTKLKGRMAHV